MSTIVRPVDLDSLTLGEGAHRSFEEGVCIMEASAWIAGEPFSDHPQCVSPVIASFCRSWNDSLNDEDRNRLLKPYIVKVIGTNTGPADDETRAWMATDWLARVCAPAWLRLAGLTGHAQTLESLARIVDGITADKARPALDAARDAAWAAARDAARAAAWDAARAAAWGAARDAAGAAAWAAARDAARAAAWDAARAAARDVRRPTLKTLQSSALVLLDEMIAVGKPADPSR